VTAVRAESSILFAGISIPKCLETCWDDRSTLDLDGPLPSNPGRDHRRNGFTGTNQFNLMLTKRLPHHPTMTDHPLRLPLRVLSLLLSPALAALAAEVFVAPAGKDTNPGTKAAPLASVHKAQEVVRGLAVRGKEPVTVWLQPGTYYAGQSLVFGPEDSGSQAAPVTWQAVKEGTVTVSGGARLTCEWKPYRDGIFVCDLPAAMDGKLKFSELYVNGKRQTRARFPNGDSHVPQPAGYILTKGALPEWQKPPEKPHTEMYYDPATFSTKEWAHPEEAVVSCFERISFDKVPFWNGQWHVRGIDRSRNAILLGEGGHQQLLWHYMQAYHPGIYPDMPFYVENVFEELDAPGEWYLDTRAGKLYYMPAPGVDLKSVVVEAALLQRVVQFIGTNDKPAHHITLRGLWIAHAASTYFEPYTPAGMGDYTIQRGGAVFVQGAEDITVDRCSLEGNNGNGFYVNCHARRVKLTNSRVADIGESGICFTGKDNYRPDKRYKCPTCGFDHWWGWDPLSDDDIPVDCEASNNLVHDVGVYAKQCGGVFIANALRIRIANNHIYNTPRAGININNGVYGGHLLENNDLHDTVRETSDHGPFNFYGREPYWCQYVNHWEYTIDGQAPHTGDRNHGFGTREEITKYVCEPIVVRHNRFAGSRLGRRIGPGLQFGIDPDDGSSNYDVYENFGVKMSIKTFCSMYSKYQRNVFLNAKPCDWLQPFDGHLETADNQFVNDLTEQEVIAKYFKDVRFGLTDDFPAWLRDPELAPVSAGPQPDVYLDDLTMARMKSGNGTQQTQLRKNCTGKTLALGGVDYERGIGDHAGNGFAAELVYALKTEYKRFVALAGVDEQTANRGSIRVQIHVDDKLVFSTPVLRGGQAPCPLNVTLPKGGKELRITIDDAGDGYEYDDADLANAGFVASGK
jgi:hypothetical protein